MATLVSTIVDQAIVELSQVPGVNTQVYASARLLQYVQDAFDMVFQQHKWNAYGSWWIATLDGSTGSITSDILPNSPVLQSTRSIPVTDYNNIVLCFPAGTNIIVRELPSRRNPYLLSGSVPIYREANYTNVNRPIRFYPLDATGTVVMRVLQEPLHPFALTDLIYIDSLMLALGAAYFYAVDDGTNPAQITKFQSMFLKRMNDMISAESDVVLELDPRYPITGASSDGSDDDGDGIGITFTVGASAT